MKGRELIWKKRGWCGLLCCTHKIILKHGHGSVWGMWIWARVEMWIDELSEGKAIKRKESKTSSNPAPTQIVLIPCSIFDRTCQHLNAGLFIINNSLCLKHCLTYDMCSINNCWMSFHLLIGNKMVNMDIIWGLRSGEKETKGIFIFKHNIIPLLYK